MKKTSDNLLNNESVQNFVLLITFIFLSCRINAQPTITSFAPTSGPVGTTVTITGINFNSTPANNIVFFGATMATVTVASTTSLTVTVPSGTNYEYIYVTNLSTNLTAYSAQPFIVTFNCGSIAFSPKVDFTVGTNPYSDVIADIDGDGKADLVVSDYNSSALSVLRNTSSVGTISFAAKVDFAMGTNPWGVAVGDIDGDGKPDVAVTRQNSIPNYYVAVYRNLSTPGTISFAAHVDFVLGNLPYFVAIGDLDGDGKPDMAAPNWINSVVSTFRNLSTPGTISFAAKVDFTTGSSPYDLDIGDLDGDGKPDLAIANYSSNTFSALRNTSTSGTISFAAKVDFTTGNNPACVEIGDLDGDGKPDLAVTNYTATSFSTFRNLSTPGTMSFAAKVDFPTATWTYGIAMGDMDGDGKPDVAAVNYTGASVSTFKNTSTSGTISFAAKVDYTTGPSPYCVAVGDLDGDNKADMAVANAGASTVSTFINPCVPLPIQLSDFRGYSGQQENHLNWTTVSEINNDYFIVERSNNNGKDFEETGKVKGAGNSSIVMSYEYSDNNYSQGINYYRLKQTDYDGNYTYSQTISISNPQISKSSISIYPVPCNQELNYEFYSEENSLTNITVTDVLGNVVVQEQIKTKRGINKSRLNIENLSEGVYFLRMENGTEHSPIKFVKE